MGIQRQGGVFRALLIHFPTLWDQLVVAPERYVLATIRMMMGFCWAGTWSFAHPPRVFVLPVVALALIPCVLYMRRINWRDPVTFAPIFLVGPVLAGLLYHILVMLAGSGEGIGTPGWFFHIFTGPLSLVLALGWASRKLMLPLTAYAVLHFVAMAWMQIAFFSGCLPRTGTGVVYLQNASCIMDIGRLRLLAFPDVALAATALGLGALGTALAVGARNYASLRRV